MEILPTDLHTFPLRISQENLIKDQGIFPLVIILLILITFPLGDNLTLLGENCCWSFLGLRGLRVNKTSNLQQSGVFLVNFAVYKCYKSTKSSTPDTQFSFKFL